LNPEDNYEPITHKTPTKQSDNLLPTNTHSNFNWRKTTEKKMFLTVLLLLCCCVNYLAVDVILIIIVVVVVIAAGVHLDDDDDDDYEVECAVCKGWCSNTVLQLFEHSRCSCH